MIKPILKPLFLVMTLAFVASSIIGCLVVEEMRFRFEFDGENRNSGKFEIVYYGIKSTESEKDEIVEDYNNLPQQISREEEDLRKYGLTPKETEIKVEDREKLSLYLKGVFRKENIFNKEHSLFLENNEEVFSIAGIEKRWKWKFRSNGRLIETEKNIILVWPSSTRILEWTILLGEYTNLPNNLTAIYLKDKK